MALLPKPLTVWVTGTDYHRSGFDRWRNNPTPSNRLVLKRIRDNVHDKNAVAVMYAGHQIGWVAKADAQLVGPALDEGCRFDIQVLESRPDHYDQNRRLQICLEKQPWTSAPYTTPEPPPLKPLYLFNGEIGESGSHRAVPRQDGKVYRLRTSTTRSSIDLVEEGGGQAGWIRKADLPYWNHIADRLDRFYAVVEGSALYLSEDLRQLERYCKPQQNEKPTSATVVNKPLNEKETTMNFNNAKSIISRVFDSNKRAATTAGYLEAGRLANRAIGRFLLARMSFLGRWINAKHVESPIGSLVIANGALLLAQQFRPDDVRVRKLTEAMATQAYQEIYQRVDIEGFIEGLLESPEIKRATRMLDESKADGKAE